MKKVFAAILFAIAAAGCNLPTSPTSTATERFPHLFVYNLTTAERNPNFSVGDDIRLAAHVNETDAFQLCYIFESNAGIQQGCNQDTGTLQNFDGINGTWHIDYRLTPVFTGKWMQWIVINGRESNRVTYTVR